MFGTDTLGLRAGESNTSKFFDRVPGQDNTPAWFDEDNFEEIIFHLTVTEARKPQPLSRRHRPIDDLEDAPAGPLLAAALARVDRTRLTGHDLVRVMKARERLVSHYQGEVAADMAELVHVVPVEDSVDRVEAEWSYAADEIRAALTLTRRSAENRLAIAHVLVERFPIVWRLLSEGQIDNARAYVILKGVTHLPEDVAAAIVDEIAPLASGLTSGQLGALIRKLSIDLGPELARQRYESATSERRIWFEPGVDGTVHLHALDLPIERARAIGRRINGYLIELKRADDPRTHDQIRADIFMDLLEGSDSGTTGRRGTVDIVVELSTLAELNERSAEIPGFGPVIADIARKVAAAQTDATWRFTATDQGKPVVAGTTRRRPTAAINRLVHALHPTCSFPGCRVPAGDCDIDHHDPWRETRDTSVANLSPKCRHDHILKHEGGWTHQVVGGEHLWTSPLGHTYVTSGQSP